MSENGDVEKVQKEITRLSAKFKANTLSGIDRERWDTLTEALASIANPELKNENVKSTAKEFLDAGLQEFKALVEKGKELEQEKSDIENDDKTIPKDMFKSFMDEKSLKDSDIRDIGTLVKNTFINCKDAALDFVEKQKENIVHFSGEVNKNVNDFAKETKNVGNDGLTVFENKAIIKITKAHVDFQTQTIDNIENVIKDIRNIEKPFIQMEKALDKGHDLIGKAADFLHKKSLQAKNISTAVKDVANGTKIDRIQVDKEMTTFKNTKMPAEYKHKILDAIINTIETPISFLEARKTIAQDKAKDGRDNISILKTQNENLKEDIEQSLTKAKDIVKEFPDNVLNKKDPVPGTNGDGRGE